MPFVPCCVECGTTGPCGCKVVGPTLGFVAWLVTGIFFWPVGAVVYCCNKHKGRRLLNEPSMVVFPRVASCFPC